MAESKVMIYAQRGDLLASQDAYPTVVVADDRYESGKYTTPFSFQGFLALHDDIIYELKAENLPSERRIAMSDFMWFLSQHSTLEHVSIVDGIEGLPSFLPLPQAAQLVELPNLKTLTLKANDWEMGFLLKRLVVPASCVVNLLVQVDPRQDLLAGDVSVGLRLFLSRVGSNAFYSHWLICYAKDSRPGNRTRRDFVIAAGQHPPGAAQVVPNFRLSYRAAERMDSIHTIIPYCLQEVLEVLLQTKLMENTISLTLIFKECPHFWVKIENLIRACRQLEFVSLPVPDYTDPLDSGRNPRSVGLQAQDGLKREVNALAKPPVRKSKLRLLLRDRSVFEFDAHSALCGSLRHLLFSPRATVPGVQSGAVAKTSSDLLEAPIRIKMEPED